MQHTAETPVQTLNHPAKSVGQIAQSIRAAVEAHGAPKAAELLALPVAKVLELARVAAALEYEDARQADAVKDASPGTQVAYRDAQRVTRDMLAHVTIAELHRAHEALDRAAAAGV